MAASSAAKAATAAWQAASSPLRKRSSNAAHSSSEPFAAWFRDHLKGFALASVFSATIAWGVYQLMALSPKWWWILAAIAGALVTLLLARLARLDLKLVPAHPDRLMGLGFLERVPTAFTPFILGLSLVVAAQKDDSDKVTLTAAQRAELERILPPLLASKGEVTANRQELIYDAPGLVSALPAGATRVALSRSLSLGTAADDPLLMAIHLAVLLAFIAAGAWATTRTVERKLVRG